MDKLEHYISRAEWFWKSGDIKPAMQSARQALKHVGVHEGKRIALRIFIARGYSRLRDFTESSRIYRELLQEEVYLPPVIMGLLHNSLSVSQNQKSLNNAGLVKLFLPGGV